MAESKDELFEEISLVLFSHQTRLYAICVGVFIVSPKQLSFPESYIFLFHRIWEKTLSFR